MGRLLASVSHELNNPANHSKCAISIGEEKGISLQGKLDLDVIASKRNARLPDRSDCAPPTHQDGGFPADTINNHRRCMCLISTHLRHNEIVLEFHPEPNLPLIPTLADQIRQVIINL
jgi:signal transduction histidine kinase